MVHLSKTSSSDARPIRASHGVEPSSPRPADTSARAHAPEQVDCFDATTHGSAAPMATPVAREDKLSPVQAHFSKPAPSSVARMESLADALLGLGERSDVRHLSPAEAFLRFEQAFTEALQERPLSTASINKAADALWYLVNDGPRPEHSAWLSWLKKLPPMVEALLVQGAADDGTVFTASKLWDYMAPDDVERQRELALPKTQPAS